MATDQLSDKEIFNVARRLDSREAVEEYLDQVCGDDRDRRGRILELVQADKGDSFLEKLPVALPETVESRSSIEREGQVIGNYKLLQKIGEGGFGVVYMAAQTSPVRRQVALKIIKPGMDSKEVLARFEAERQALAMMDHPNIAKVFDGGQMESGHPYFVMELVKGVPLTRFCDENKLDMRTRLQLFANICNAIQHAHQKGIIHRDIKPSNVLVTLHDGKPVPKVIDFGVAKAISQQLTVRTLFTKYGQMVGTPQYMSPEQAEMSGLDIDTRSDIYSLGVLLYELITGTTPIDPNRLRETGYAEMQRMIREEEPPRPSKRLSTLGEQSVRIAAFRGSDPRTLSSVLRGELDWIAMKALEKDRSRRYDTAKGLSLDIQRHLAGDAVSACPPSATYLLAKTFQKHRRLVILAAGMFLLTVAGLAVTTYLWMGQKREKENALRAEAATKQERQQVQRLNLSLTKKLYAADMNNAMTAWKKNDLRQMHDLLAKYEGAPLRGWEWHHLRRLHDDAMPSDLVHPELAPLRLYFSPDNRHAVATHSRGSVLSFIDWISPHRDVKRLGSLREGVYFFSYAAFSPDGSKLVYPSDDFSSLIERDIRSGEEGEIPPPQMFGQSEVYISSAQYSPDGQNLVIAVEGHGLVVFDIEASVYQQALPLKGIGRCEAIEFSADGEYVAVTSEPVTVWNTKNWEKLYELKGHTKEVTSLKFVNQDAWLATGSRDRRIMFWDLASGQRINTLGPFEGEVRAVAFDAESNVLAAGFRDRKLKTWKLPDLTEVEELRSYDGLYSATFAENGELTYGAFGGGIAVESRKRRGAVQRAASGGYCVDMDFTSDGTQLVCLVNPSDESNPEQGVKRLSCIQLGPQSELSYEYLLQDFNGSCLAASRLAPNPSWVAIGDEDSTRVLVLDFGTEELSTSYDLGSGEPVGVSAVCFSADEHSVYCGLKDGTVMELKLAGGGMTPVIYKSRHAARVTAIAALSDGRCITGAGDSSVMIWNRGTLESQFRMADSEGTWIRGIDAYKSTVAFGLFGRGRDDKRVFFIDQDGHRHGIYGHTFSIQDVHLIEEGKTIVSVGGDREIKFWNCDSFEQRLAIRESEILTTAAVSPDESVIAAGTREGSVLLYHSLKSDANQ